MEAVFPEEEAATVRFENPHDHRRHSYSISLTSLHESASPLLTLQVEGRRFTPLLPLQVEERRFTPRDAPLARREQADRRPMHNFPRTCTVFDAGCKWCSPTTHNPLGCIVSSGVVVALPSRLPLRTASGEGPLGK